MKIGIVIMLAENQEGIAPGYPHIRKMALRAEELGLDSIWLYDHLFYEQGDNRIGIWECWTMLSALAEATQRVELGSLVLCSPFRNPALLAKMAVTLDEVSGGRFTLGIGAGWNEPEFTAFGYPFDHRADRLEEALQILQPLLKEGKAHFNGKYYTAVDCPIIPRGPRPAGPPLMVGGEGPRLLRLTARYADQWNICWRGSPQALDPWIEKMRRACEEEGRDPAELEITVLEALAYKDLGAEPKLEGYLEGPARAAADAFHQYEQRGVKHLMLHILPYTEEALNRMVEAVSLYRNPDKGVS
jgi:probable F420-dependent oxidoreductase